MSKSYLIFIIAFFFFLNNSNAQQGKLDSTFNTYDDGLNGDGFDNYVRTLSLQTDGNLIVGGDFLSFNGNPLQYLTRLKPDGTVDDDFNTGLGFNGKVYASFVQYDGKILAGGNFTSYNGSVVGRLIRLNNDGSQDLTFNTSIAATNGIINQIIQQADGKIIIVGSFTKYNGVMVNRIARLLSNGDLDTSFLTGSGAPATINSVQIQSDGKIILAGNFTKFKGIDNNRVVRLNSDGSIDSGFDVGSGFDNEINAIVLQSDGKIVLGGEFTLCNGVQANRITRLNPDGSIDAGFLSGTGLSNGAVQNIKIDSVGNIMVGGSFTGLYNGLDVNRLLFLDSVGNLKNDFDIGSGPASASVLALSNSIDGSWYIGGSFSVFDSQNQGKLAKIDANGVHDIGYLSAGVGFDNSVLKVLALTDNKVMIFGSFSKFNGAVSSKIARLLPNGELDTTFNTAQTGANNLIKAATQQSDRKLIIGGNFTSYNNVNCNRIARIFQDGSLDTSFVLGSGFNGQVYSIAIQPDQKILVAGSFTKYNGATVGHVVRLLQDGTVDTGFNIGLGADGTIEVIKIEPEGKILLGGRFDTFNNLPYSRLIRLNTNGSIDTGFNIGTGFDKYVYALDIQSDGKVIVGGSFLVYNGVSKKRILRLNYNGSLDASFESGTGLSNGDVRCILVQPDNRLLVGGKFSGNYDGTAVSRILRLTEIGIVDTSFSATLNNSLFTMAFTADFRLIIGGDFNSVSGIAKHRVGILKLCNNSSAWDGVNWSNGLPSDGKEIIFKGDYQISSSVNACSCSINSNKTVTIVNGKTLGLSFNYSGSGVLVLEDGASLYQSDDEIVNTGIIYLKRNTSPILKFDYTYWSSPVENHKLFDVSPNTLSDKFFSFDTEINDWKNESSSNTMSIGKGYIIRGPQNFSITVPEKFEAVFKGVPVNGKIKTIIGNANNYNLIGNPYPSALDADTFLIKNSTKIKGTLYFWTHNTAITNGEYSSNDYALYNLLGGVGTRKALSSGENESIPNGTIASCQSFFVESLSAGEVKFENDMRIVEKNSLFYKPGKILNTARIDKTEKSRIWLNFSNERGAFKQLLLGYLAEATNQYDTAFDGESLEGNQYIDFYTYNEDKKWIIQGRDLNSLKTDEVAIGYKSEINGDFTISIDHLDGLFNSEQVFLEDKEKMILHDLKKAPYEFSTAKGTFINRFVLKYNSEKLSLYDNLQSKNRIVAYKKNNQIVVESKDSVIKKIMVYDVSGKLIAEEKNSLNGVTILGLKAKNQLLVLKINTENGLETQKIMF